MSYAIFVPPGERRDEGYHFEVLDYIASTGQLPSRTAEMTEAYQPPLYYVSAALIKWVAVGSESHYKALQFNSHGYFYDKRLGVDPSDNINHYLHPKSHWLPTTDPLTIGFIIVRLFNVVLGLLNLLVSYALVGRVWPQDPHRRLLAMAILTSWQSLQYTFGSINNDNAVILMSTVCLWLIVRQYQDMPSWTSSIVLGFAFGSALLSKVSALVLMAPFVAAATVSGWRATRRYVAVSALVMAATAGWWFVWNAVAVNDPLGLAPMYALYPDLRPTKPIELAYVVDAARLFRTYTSLWLYFDSEIVLMPRPLYWVFDAVFVLGIAGIVRRLMLGWRAATAGSISMAIVGLYVVAMCVASLYYALTNMVGNSGRHLLQISTPIAICIAFGVDQWLTPRLRRWIWALTAALWMTSGAISLYGYYIPAFHVQPAPARIENPIGYRYGDVVELTGVKDATIRAIPGHHVVATLYWRALAKGTNELVVVLASDLPEFRDRRSFPGAGRFLAGDWEPGDTWTDEYMIEVPDDTRPGTYYIMVRIIHDDTGVLELSHSLDGKLVMPIVITLIIEEPSP